MEMLHSLLESCYGEACTVVYATACIDSPNNNSPQEMTLEEDDSDAGMGHL